MLTVRHWPPKELGIDSSDVRSPRRVVLGTAPMGAKIHPCLEFDGEISDLLERLGREEVVQLMVEGGPGVAHAFHHAHLVNQYVVYLAPALFAGSDAASLFSGMGASSLDGLWRGKFEAVERLGDDIRIDLVPAEHLSRC